MKKCTSAVFQKMIIKLMALRRWAISFSLLEICLSDSWIDFSTSYLQESKTTEYQQVFISILFLFAP